MLGSLRFRFYFLNQRIWVFFFLLFMLRGVDKSKIISGAYYKRRQQVCLALRIGQSRGGGDAEYNKILMQPRNIICALMCQDMAYSVK